MGKLGFSPVDLNPLNILLKLDNFDYVMSYNMRPLFTGITQGYLVDKYLDHNIL